MSRKNGTSRKNRILVIVFAAAAIVAAATGIVYASLRDTTARVENVFEPAAVACAVSEEFDGLTKENVKIQNTDNVPALIRVKVIVNWMDKDGNVIMDRPEKYRYYVNADGTRVQEGGVDKERVTITLPSDFDSKWTNSENVSGMSPNEKLIAGYWYYNGIVQPEEFTAKLIESIKVDYPIDPIFSLNVQILAEAIQVTDDEVAGGLGAAAEKWGMVFDGTSWSHASP